MMNAGQNKSYSLRIGVNLSAPAETCYDALKFVYFWYATCLFFGITAFNVIKIGNQEKCYDHQSGYQP